MPLKIIVYPKASNPYQNLLYDPFVRFKDTTVRYGEFIHRKSLLLDLVVFPYRLLMMRLDGFSIFHVHWFYEFQIPGFNNILTKPLFTAYVIILFLFIKILGYKLIWTVHDIVPHNKLFIHDLFVTKIISRFCNAIVVLNNNTKEKLQAQNIHTPHVYEIPLGNYIHQYNNSVSGAQARTKLHINSKSFVFLYFGRIEEYKGVEDLLKVFKELNLPNSELIVAGEIYDNNLKSRLVALADQKNVHLNIRFIPENEVQYYFNSADVVVCPYKAIENSSTILLSASFKKPTIFPDIGNLKTYPEELGFKYSSRDTNGLLKAMKKAYTSRHLIDLGDTSYTYVKNFDWNILAEKMCDVYKDVSSR